MGLDSTLESVAAGYIFGGLLLLLRMSLTLIVVPGFSPQSIPVRVRALFALLLTVVMDWGLGGVWIALPNDFVTPLIMFFREALIGAGIGLSVRIIFAAIEGAGAVAGTSMALSLNVLVDPATGQQNLALGSFIGMFAALAFVAMDGHHHVIRTLAIHLETYPVGVTEFSVDVTVISEAIVQLMRTAMLLAAPVLAVTLLIYVALALVGRLVPSVNLFAVGLSLIIGAGLLVLSMEGDAIISTIERGIEALPKSAERLTVSGP